MSRPFGVALLLAGFDKTGASLYHTDPSGTYVHYEAKAIGSGSEGAQKTLEDAWHAVRVECVTLFFLHFLSCVLQV